MFHLYGKHDYWTVKCIYNLFCHQLPFRQFCSRIPISFHVYSCELGLLHRHFVKNQRQAKCYNDTHQIVATNGILYELR